MKEVKSKLKQLEQYAMQYDIMLTNEMLDKFEIYSNLLIEWNKTVNLTAITDCHEIIIKHFLDSILLVKYAKLKQGAKVIDVGTGAGFPGIPLKIIRPDIQLTLLDSLNKRVTFLIELAKAIGIQAEIIHGRAEQCGKQPAMRQQFDIATARAVAPLAGLCEYCLPLVKIGGQFVAMKGFEIEEEIATASNAIATLGGEIGSVEKLVLPLEYRRSFVTINKISQTPAKYPRTSAKITKAPL